MVTPEQRLMQAMHQPIDNVSPISHNRRESDRYWELALQHIAEVSEEQRKLAEKFDTHFNNSAERHDQLAAKIVGNDVIIASILEGFPNKDPRGHCEAHDKAIAKAERRKAMINKLVDELLKYGLLGLAGWLFTLVWAAAVKGPK